MLALIDRLRRASGRRSRVLVTTGTVTSARLLGVAPAGRPRLAPIRAGRPAAPMSGASSIIGGPISRSGSSRSCGPTSSIETQGARHAAGAAQRPHVGALVPAAGSAGRPHPPAARRASICASRRTRCRPSGCAGSARQRRHASAISRPPPAPLPVDEAELARLAAHGRRPAAVARRQHPCRRGGSGRRGASRAEARGIRASSPSSRRAIRRAPTRSRAMLEARASPSRGARAREPIDAATDIYLADTLGELGLFYRLAGDRLHRRLAGAAWAATTRSRRRCSTAPSCTGPDMSNCAAHRPRLSPPPGAPSPCTDGAELAAAVGRAPRRSRRPGAARRRRAPASPPTIAPCSTRCWSASRRGSTV